MMEDKMSNLANSMLGRIAVKLMIVLALALALTPTKGALAGFATTIDAQSTKATDLDRVRQALENKKIAQTLADLGYNEQEINTRLSQLDESEIHALAGQLDQALVPAGDGTVGVIIAVVVVILVVLGILSLMGRSVSIS
jgi:Flp pilus assembly protein TadB